jgi:hypothetical protein
MSITFDTNSKFMSQHYPPFTAPWGRATKAPTHQWVEGLPYAVPKPGIPCTKKDCPHCTYVIDGVRRRRVADPRR